MKIRLLLLVVVGAGAAVYCNSLSGAFVFDDRGAILDNPTIRRLWPLTDVLSPPATGLPVTGRPLTNLSFALNYAAHGTSVGGYHLVNLALHLAAALTLFGLIRRTLQQPVLAGRFDAAAPAIAGAAALLWCVHPLNTAAVTYLSQRAEVLASLLLLLALYAFARHAASPRPRRWLGLAVAATWLGIGAKEIIAAVPVLLLAYDRLLLRTPWREVFGRKAAWHLAFFASWIPLGWLVLDTQNRGATWGADAGYTAWQYALLQTQALPHYLRLAFWPIPLVFDYGRDLAPPPLAAALPAGFAILAVLAMTLLGVRRWPAIAFVGLGFFAILAPTSSVVPIADPVFEHRMYLPSAAVLALAVAGLWRVLGAKFWWAAVPAAVLLGAGTIDRNRDYASALALWQDTVEKRPDNARARTNLGEILLDQQRRDAAIEQFQHAYRLTPGQPLGPHNLAVALDLAGRRDEAIPLYREAIALQPRNFLARTNLANALAVRGETTEARELYEALVRDVPAFADARAGYGRLLLERGRIEAAIEQLGRAQALEPDDPDASFSLGEALVRAKRLPEAIDAFRNALRLRPRHVPTLTNLGNALLLGRQPAAAIESYRAALNEKRDPMVHANLGLALLLNRQPELAREQFEAALELDPTHPVARAQLERLSQ